MQELELKSSLNWCIFMIFTMLKRSSEQFLVAAVSFLKMRIGIFLEKQQTKANFN